MNKLQKFLNIKGQYCSIDKKKDLTVNAAHKGHKVVKITMGLVCRAGIEYDNMKDVQEKRANGELPAENAGLPWGKWFLYPHIIEHKNKHYYRFSVAKGISNKYPTTKYYVNGDEVDKETAMHYCRPSEFAEKELQDCFTISEDNLIDIKSKDGLSLSDILG